MPIAINDPDDPRIEAYRAVRERDLVGRENRFIVEGEVVLRVLVRQHRFPVECLSSPKTGSNRFADYRALPPDVPVYSANRAVMDAIVGFPIHRGILAVGRRPAACPRPRLSGEAAR